MVTMGFNVLHVAGTSLAIVARLKLRKRWRAQTAKRSSGPDETSDHLFITCLVQTDPSGEETFIRGRGVQ